MKALRNRLALLPIVLISVLSPIGNAEAVVTVTKDRTSGNVYVDAGDGKQMLSRPSLGVTTSGIAFPIQVLSDGTVVTRSLSQGADSVTAYQGTSPWLTSITQPLPSGTNEIGSVDIAGKTPQFAHRHNYQSTSVTTAAYVELIASTAEAVTTLYVFDSSGQTLVLATGEAGSEVDQPWYIVPGGNDTVSVTTIPAGTRLSIKAVSATANKGELVINASN